MKRRRREVGMWRQVVWYGWATGVVLILLNASVAWLLGFEGLTTLPGG